MTQCAPQLEEKTDISPGYKVVIFNDDYTPYNLVVLALQIAAGLSDEVAAMVAKEAHESDCAVVKSGLTEEEADLMAAKIIHITKADRFPGVRCEAHKDD